MASGSGNQIQNPRPRYGNIEYCQRKKQSVLMYPLSKKLLKLALYSRCQVSWKNSISQKVKEIARWKTYFTENFFIWINRVKFFNCLFFSIFFIFLGITLLLCWLEKSKFSIRFTEIWRSLYSSKLWTFSRYLEFWAVCLKILVQFSKFSILIQGRMLRI